MCSLLLAFALAREERINIMGPSNWQFIFQIRISKIGHCASTYFNCNDAAHCDVLIIEKKKPAHSHKILTTGTQETTRSRNDDWKRNLFPRIPKIVRQPLNNRNSQCPRIDLNKRFLTRLNTTTAWKLIPHRSKISKNWNPPQWELF